MDIKNHSCRYCIADIDYHAVWESVSEIQLPEDAFKYAVNGKIIRTVERKNSALVVYSDHEIKTALINRHGEKWKNTFLPVKHKLLYAEDCMLALYEVATPVMVTYEGKSNNNFYILVSPPYDAVISDNMNSVFEEFYINEIKQFVAYVENSG